MVGRNVLDIRCWRGESGNEAKSRWYLVELLFTVPESGPMPFPLDDVISSFGYSYVADSRD